MLSDYFIQRLSENLPYVPTEEQADLIARLSAFLWDDNVPSVFLLKGYAGTGKTSLIGALVKTLESFERTCVLLAPTGRAAKVFASYAGHAAYTIHKKIYRQRAFTGDFTGFQLAHNAHKNTFFIVDEASMIANETAEGRVYGSGLLLDDLFDFVYSGSGCRLILLGDTAQLPPVGQVQSTAFRSILLCSPMWCVSSKSRAYFSMRPVCGSSCRNRPCLYLGFGWEVSPMCAGWGAMSL